MGFGPAAPQTSTTRFRDSGAGALTAVTDELLRQPPADDWLAWRRTRDNQGYSPLDQVTRENVGELRAGLGARRCARVRTRRRRSCTTG